MALRKIIFVLVILCVTKKCVSTDPIEIFHKITGIVKTEAEIVADKLKGAANTIHDFLHPSEKNQGGPQNYPHYPPRGGYQHHPSGEPSYGNNPSGQRPYYPPNRESYNPNNYPTGQDRPYNGYPTGEGRSIPNQRPGQDSYRPSTNQGSYNSGSSTAQGPYNPKNPPNQGSYPGYSSGSDLSNPDFSSGRDSTGEDTNSKYPTNQGSYGSGTPTAQGSSNSRYPTNQGPYPGYASESGRPNSDSPTRQVTSDSNTYNRQGSSNYPVGQGSSYPDNRGGQGSSNSDIPPFVTSGPRREAEDGSSYPNTNDNSNFDLSNFDVDIRNSDDGIVNNSTSTSTIEPEGRSLISYKGCAEGERRDRGGKCRSLN